MEIILLVQATDTTNLRAKGHNMARHVISNYSLSLEDSAWELHPSEETFCELSHGGENKLYQPTYDSLVMISVDIDLLILGLSRLHRGRIAPVITTFLPNDQIARGRNASSSW